MGLETTVSLLTSLISVAVAILLAGIPWAYGIHGRLTKIESCLSDERRGGRPEWAELDTRLRRLESTVAVKQVVAS